MDTIAVAEARDDLSETCNRVRLQRRMLVLTRRGKPQVAMVPIDLAEAAEAAGGIDAAIAALKRTQAPAKVSAKK